MMNSKRQYSRIFMWVRCLLGYTFHLFGSIFFLTFIFPLSFIFLPFGKLSYLFLNASMRAYLAFLTRVCLPSLKIYTIKEISGFNSISQDRPVIFVANHSGKLDGPFLLGILKNTAPVMKPKYASMPVYSKLVKNLDFISLDQHSREALEKTILHMNEVLTNGKNLLIFPEGTRSSPKRLLPFKELGFRIARGKNIEIVPIVIHSDFALMAKTLRSYFPEKKYTVTIRCLAPVKPLENESSIDMAARVRKIMVKEMAEIEESIQ